MTVVTRQILISGKVQGVGFRNYVLTSALVAGLFGWVRNLADGRVEVLAQGEQAAVDLFIEQVKKGPALSRVSAVELHAVDEELKFAHFSVAKDGDRPWPGD